MNAKNLLPLTAAVVFALCAGAMVVSATQADTGRTAAAAAAERIVDLPTVTVTPDAAVNPGDVLCRVGTGFWTAHILAIGHFSRRLDVLRLSVAQFAANSLYAGVSASYKF